MNKTFITIIFILTTSAVVLAQQPPRPPQGGPPRGGLGQPPQPHRDWFKGADTNADAKVDGTEFQSALDATFSAIDRDSNGMIDSVEMPRPPRGGQMGPQGGRPQGPPPGGQPGQPSPFRPDAPTAKMLPPFFFADRAGEGTSVSRSEFDRIARGVFTEMDKDADGLLTKEEARPPKRPDTPGRLGPGQAPPPPNGQFVGAEMRFGDLLVKGQPFSAQTVVEDTRRLYDGSTVTSARNGAIYRDSAGRTRREQTLQLIGGVNIGGQNGNPQTLVFINDFDARAHYFLDILNKVARKHEIADAPPGEPPAPDQAKTESLGKKTFEGVEAEGKRTTFEIPAGRLGNDKPIQVISETWFSPELQTVVYSRHVDPIAGEHVFKLVNIRRGEQNADLFAVPSDYRIETDRRKNRPE